MVNIIKKSEYPEQWDMILDDHYDFIDGGHRKGSSSYGQAVYQINEKWFPELPRELDGYWITDTFIWSEMEGIPRDEINVLYRAELEQVVTTRWVIQK